MLRWVIYGMVYLGSLLMIYNIYGFIRFARYVSGLKSWTQGNGILRLPIVLLVFFFLGYVAVGVIGKPDLIVAGILFGGSIFVYVMYRLLSGITQRIVENERREAEVMAMSESNRVKSSFLASVSHEMRTPMNVILGLNAQALRHPELPAEAREALEKVGHSARHLSGLIDNILDMQRIETGELSLRSEPFALTEVLEELNAISGTLCEHKGLEYRFQADPAALRGYRGDAKQLVRAVMCLLDNAVKFTPAPGRVSLTVGCAEASDDSCALRFEVRDSGVGIDADFLTVAFDRFTQEDASFSTAYGGSGMGLAIARSLVEHMGGRIEAASEKGAGSVFTATLPLPVADLPEPDPAPMPAETGLEGRRVLAVEDVDENAEILQDLLELEGMDCDRAVNGAEAVEMFARTQEGHYDAVLMDLRMPQLDGLEATRRIRRLDRPDARSVPIIALTANTLDCDIQNALDAGMNAHLAKPIDPDKLYDTLKHWINRPEKKESKRT